MPWPPQWEHVFLACGAVALAVYLYSLYRRKPLRSEHCKVEVGTPYPTMDLKYARETVSYPARSVDVSGAAQQPRSPYPTVDGKFARETIRGEAEEASSYPKMDIKYAREAAYHPTWQADESKAREREKSHRSGRKKSSTTRGTIYLLSRGTEW